MSTLGAGTGKERSGMINFWIFLLVIALLALIANAVLSTKYASEEGKARDLVADVRVLSQQIAKAAQDAASGGVDAFDELESTRKAVQANLDALNKGGEGNPAYAGNKVVGVPLQRVTEIWGPMNDSARRILDSRELVLGLTETADRFASAVPLIQAEMDEVVRAMGESGNASFAQLSTAIRQIVLDRKSVV